MPALVSLGAWPAGLAGLSTLWGTGGPSGLAVGSTEAGLPGFVPLSGLTELSPPPGSPGGFGLSGLAGSTAPGFPGL